MDILTEFVNEHFSEDKYMGARPKKWNPSSKEKLYCFSIFKEQFEDNLPPKHMGKIHS
jgi:hypothetical protein